MQPAFWVANGAYWSQWSEAKPFQRSNKRLWRVSDSEPKMSCGSLPLIWISVSGASYLSILTSASARFWDSDFLASSNSFPRTTSTTWFLNPFWWWNHCKPISPSAPMPLRPAVSKRAAEVGSINSLRGIFGFHPIRRTKNKLLHCFFSVSDLENHNFENCPLKTIRKARLLDWFLENRLNSW